jgi:hypothetical protein
LAAEGLRRRRFADWSMTPVFMAECPLIPHTV